MPGTIVQGAAGASVAQTGWSGSVLGALALGIALLSLLFLPEFAAAVDVWRQSTAYGHCFLILPMTLYLLWDRREIIQRSLPRCELGWALLAVPVSAVWLAAERLGIMEGRQLAAICAFELLFLVILGWRLFWLLSGPLLYLFFLVPFGAFVTPALQDFTTAFTTTGLKLLAIPYYADHFVIETPAGTFLIAEACAGLRFLIAAIAFGVFYAILSFRSPVRRTGYILLSIAVPIVANGFRALGIVVLGQILGSAQAAAADHIIYGWVFFSIIMVLLVLLGQALREPRAVVEWTSVAGAQRATGLAYVGMLLAVALAAAGPAVAAYIDRASVAMPLAGQIDWVIPPECSAAAVASAPTVRRMTLRCGAETFQVDTITYSSRATWRELIEDRRRQTNEIAAEDVTAGALGDVPPGDGAWTEVQTSETDGVVAYATWAEGQPASGGLAARFAQAERSMIGSAYQPVMIVITAAQPGPAATPARKAAIARLGAFVRSQQDLTGQISRISRVGARG